MHSNRAWSLVAVLVTLTLFGGASRAVSQAAGRVESIPGMPYKRLSAPDMVLHTSAHMFQDGDLEGGLRQLTDIDGLLRAFCETATFWDRLLEEEARLGARLILVPDQDECWDAQFAKVASVLV